MQIISIKTSKTPNQDWLTFSNHSFLPFFVDDVVKLSLTKNQEIDESKYDLILQKSLLFKGREFSLRQVAISPKVAKIINQKLKIFFKKLISKYQINASNLDLNEISQEIISELQNKNLLNEVDFINFFIKKNRKKSRQQIIYLLQQYGLDSDSLSLTDFNQNDLDKIKLYLNKKNISKKELTDFKERNKIKAALFRRGFNLYDINAVIDEMVNFR